MQKVLVQSLDRAVAGRKPAQSLSKPKTAHEFNDALEVQGVTLEEIAKKFKEILNKRVQVEKFLTTPLTDPQTGAYVYEEVETDGTKKVIPRMTVATKINSQGKEVPIKIIEEEVDSKEIIRLLDLYTRIMISEAPKETKHVIGMNTENILEVHDLLQDLDEDTKDRLRSIDADFDELEKSE